jgi:adenylylsulfate kinase-like enzyme
MQTQQGFTIWFTGLPGAGKRTLAAYIAPRLQMIGRRVEVLDGDEIRETLLGGGTYVQPGKGFDTEVRRLGFLARMLTKNGVVAICTSISPVREAREQLKKSIGRFVEIYVDCPIEKLMFEREKQLYRVPGDAPVPGHTAPYEPPPNPDLKVDTGTEKVEESAARVFYRLKEMGYVSAEEVEVLAGGVEPPPPTPDEELLAEPPEAQEVRDRLKEAKERREARAAQLREAAARTPAPKAAAKEEKAPAKAAPAKAPAKAKAAGAEKAPAKAAAAQTKAPKASAKPAKPVKAVKGAKAVKEAKPPKAPAQAKVTAKATPTQVRPTKARGAREAAKAKAAPRREAAKVSKTPPRTAKAPAAKAKAKR